MFRSRTDAETRALLMCAWCPQFPLAPVPLEKRWHHRDHLLFTFNRKRMGLRTSALLCAQAETTGQVSRTMQPIPSSQFIGRPPQPAVLLHHRKCAPRPECLDQSSAYSVLPSRIEPIAARRVHLRLKAAIAGPAVCEPLLVWVNSSA